MLARLHGKFATKLSVAFALIAIMTSLLVVVASYVAWTHQFNMYVRQNLYDIASMVSTAASSAYVQSQGWNFSYNAIPQVALGTDIRIQIVSSEGNVVYDDIDMRRHAQEMLTNNLTRDAGYGEIDDFASRPTAHAQQVPIRVNGETVGHVAVYALSASGFLSQRDLALRSASMWTMVAAGVAAIAFASLGGWFYARRLVRPIRRVTDTARALRSGEATARTGLVGDNEIAQLGEVFDTMADSIEADRELERRLTSDVAHELRTPLMGIQATVECIEDGVYEADSETLGIIQAEVRRLTRLTNVILELSRLETGALPVAMQRIDLAVPLMYAVDAYGALFEQMNLHFEAYVRDNIYVTGDAERIQQAVGNLLSNAARYTHEGATVTLASYEQGEWAVIEVKDTGIGMNDAELALLFKRFWRADAARARATGGVGIGLPITKEIIEKHHGRIEVESKENEGTTFRIFLPKVR